MTQPSNRVSRVSPSGAHPSSPSLWPAALTTSAFALIAVGLSVIAWSRNYVNHNVPLTAALEGELIRFRGRRAGELGYYTAGPVRKGVPPLVFIHSINAAASSFEMKPLYDYYARSRRVIALDLPGYGFSERRDRAYQPALYRDAILDLIEQPLGGAAVDVVALSLGCEFVALAAQARPSLFRSLAFLSATGLSRRSERLRPNPTLFNLLRVPAWRRPIYDVLTSRPSLRYFLQANQRTRLNRALADYAYITSHQPDAEYAPYAFISFKLFTPTIFDVYRALSQPCLAIIGQDPFAGYDRADELRDRPNWRIVVMQQAGSLVHWDEPRAVTAQLDAHLAANLAAK